MQELIGKRVWVVQRHDFETSVTGIVHSITEGFIAISEQAGVDPTVYVNLVGVAEIEVVPPDYVPPRPREGRLLRFPGGQGKEQ